MGLSGKTKILNLNEDERYINIKSIKILKNNGIDVEVVIRIYESKDKRDINIGDYIGKSSININHGNDTMKYDKIIKKWFNPLSIIDKKSIYEAIYDYIKSDSNIIKEAKDV